MRIKGSWGMWHTKVWAITALGCLSGEALLMGCGADPAEDPSAAAARDENTTVDGEGPFDLPQFADRLATAPVNERPAPVGSLVAAETAAPLVFDDEGGSNELILRLDYGNPDRLHALLPAAAPGRPRGEVDRAFFSAVATRQPSVGLAFGQPVHARHLIERGRLGAESSASASSSRAMAEVEQYIVLRYPSVPLARAALERLKSERGVASVSMNEKGSLSWYPDDLYFQSYAVWGPGPQAMPGTQWGMKGMNFPSAWDKSQGFAHVGVIDGGYPAVVIKDDSMADDKAGQNLHLDATHDDLEANYRRHFNPPQLPFYLGFRTARERGWHATHVTGIIAAQANNGTGVAGGCPTCSVSNFFWYATDELIPAFKSAIDTGMQVVNWSGELLGDPEHTEHKCPQHALCPSVQALKDRDILLIQSSGNFNKAVPPFPSNLAASDWTILAVGGTEINNPALSGGEPTSGSRWFYDAANGSTLPGQDGVLGPAKSVVSTAPRYTNPAYDYMSNLFAMCGDYTSDESRARFPGGMSATYINEGVGDGYGSCTGTSMAAPHVAALAGLIRSIDPLMSAVQVRTIIQNSGNLSNQRTNQLGSGLPNAMTAVNAAIAANPRRLTPLFSFYSSTRSDSFYTTIPQMAAAALTGTLMPRVTCSAGMTGCTSEPAYSSAYGTAVTGHGASGGAYTSFPGIATIGYPSRAPMAEVWVFTTHENPKDPSIPLVPLYRLSWKCGDSPAWAQPSICYTNSSHTDTVYTADPAGVEAFSNAHYKLDGIEGYIYPKTMAQPPGTVRLMRKYNPTRDDHAIFPETKLSAMIAQGYTDNSGSDWLGYVYPNTGPVPTIQ